MLLGWRFAWLLPPIFLLAFGSLLGHAIASDGPDPKQREEEFRSRILPLLRKYCLDCHSGSEASAGLALNHFSSYQSLLKERQVWNNVVQRVRVGQMPPPDDDAHAANKLSDIDRQELVDWIKSVLTEVDCGKTPNPGRVTMRRLNRHEYHHTVRDLLQVDFAPAKDFPGDDVGYGFDNIGDVLTLPPLLMEKYLSAAEEISRKAILAPPTEPPFEKVVKATQLETKGQIYKLTDAINFYSGGTASFAVEAPWSGDFRLTVLGWSSRHENIPASMRVEVDDKELTEVDVSAPENAPADVEIPLRLKQGKHSIALTFTNDAYTASKNGLPPMDRNLYILEAKVTGRKRPPKPDEKSLPSSHRMIVTAEPSRSLSPADAAKKVLGVLMSRAYRRPATKAEIARIATFVVKEYESGSSWEESLQVGLQAMLVSPHFLFKIESPRPSDDGYPSLSDFELATRLSYFLWGSMPDEKLFRLAEQKQLHLPEVLEEQVRRMIKDRKSNALIENFCGQWLTLRKLDQLEPNKSLFPQWNDSLRNALRRETFTFFAGVMRDDLSVLKLLDGDFTYVNEELARFYGIPNVKGNEFRRVSLDGTPRMGLLTQGAILAVTSNPTRTSPVKRGRFILDNILGTPPPPAPPGVPELEKSELRGSLRERMEQHRTNPACASCHQLMDPLGFALENYDAVGKWRTTEAGKPIITTGVLPDGKGVQDANDLIRLLRDEYTEPFVRCLSEKMMTYALGRGIEYYDRCQIDKICSEIKKQDYRFSALLIAIVQSDPFLRRGEREEP